MAAVLADRRTTHQPLGDLLMLEAPPVRILPALHGWFRHVIGETRQFRVLALDQLADVLAAPDEERRDVFIGGVVDPGLGTLALVRGDLERVTVPLSLFRPSGKASPNFRRFELDDYGHVLRFGNYEATSDVVLWQIDPAYRKRAKEKERNQARGFGASLRRLRKQHGLSQSGFPGVPRKTISRIEKGLVKKPRQATLARLSRALGVAPDEIETF